MAPRRSARNAPKSKPEVVEVSSDSPSDYGDIDHQTKDQSVANKRKSDQDEEPSSPPNKKQKLPMRVKATTKTTPSGRRRSVSIEIPLPQSSARGKGKREIFKEVKDSEEEDEEAEDANEVFKTPMERKPKHFKFDDDDHEEFVTPLERPAAKMAASKDGRRIDDVVDDSEENEVDEDEEEEEESDDEAPEAVSTNQAAAQAAKSAQAAAKAAEQQEAAKKRKRQERDAKLRKQTEERRVALEAVKRAAREAEAAQESDDQSEPEEAPRRKRIEVPDVLPPEFLESDDEDEDAMDLDQPKKRSKITFDRIEKEVARESRAPADTRVGSTVYRVMADKSERKLAPKMDKQARNTKQALLNRHRAPVKRKGFLGR